MDKYTETMRSAFKEEAFELLGELEHSLLELEKAPENHELIDRVFRAMHTIKGSGAMFGFEEISEFTHEVETVFDLVRNDKLPVTRELIDLTLMARDQIRSMLESEEDPGTAIKGTEIITLLRKLSQGVTPGEKEAARKTEIEPGPENQVAYRIRFRPSEDIFLHGTNPVLLLNELRELGECEIIAHTGEIPTLDKIDPESCYIFWDLVLTTGKGINAIKDVFIFVEDDSELNIEAIDERPETKDKIETEVEDKKLGEILIERGNIEEKKLQKVLSSKKPIGELLVDAGLVSSTDVEAALQEQQKLKLAREKRQQEEQTSSIRVHSHKLDTLVDLVGELVTVQARLSQTTADQGNSELLAISEEVERLIAELRDNAMSLRMVPIGTSFSRFKRLVRDLSNKLGKKIELTTEGAETELDKTVIERLNDPLVHLIRNCIDHGIELPEERKKIGKPETGTIHLSSSYSGAYVLIQIKDDGAGLSREKILASAVKKGIIAPETELSEKDIYRLIFSPGFSTAVQVTGLSGRGVGMDVVKKAIDNLGGSVKIDSQSGQGTTITLKIPLTLAIIDGLLVKIADFSFVIPLSAVEDCVELSKQDVEQAHGRNILKIGESLLPYVNLREMFMIEGEPPELQQIVTTQSEGHKVGFVIDQVTGQLQTVIKSLGKMYRDVEGVSGATILGDGTVALILDILKLTQKAVLEEQADVESAENLNIK